MNVDETNTSLSESRRREEREGSELINPALNYTFTPITKADLRAMRRKDEGTRRRSKLARRCAARGRGR